MEKTSTKTRLVGELGADDATFAIVDEEGYLHNTKTLTRSSYTHLVHAVEAYLSELDGEKPSEICFAVASPISDERIQFTNSPWRFSVYATSQRLKVDRIELINDFTARALAIPFVAESRIVKIGGGSPEPNKSILVVGPEVGLGVSALVPQGEDYQALATEGGHTSLAPGNELEIELLRVLFSKFSHVSAERVISRQGLPHLFQAIAEYRKQSTEELSAETIIERGLRNRCSICRETMRIFTQLLGSFCANAALTTGAQGGVYLVSSLTTKAIDFLISNGFRKRFEEKGRFKDYMAEIPTYVVTSPNPALIGATVNLGIRPKPPSSRNQQDTSHERPH